MSDSEKQVRARLAGTLPHADFPRDGLVKAGRVQAVGARQIEDADRAAGGGRKYAFLALDGHAGIVGHLLAAAGQAVEQRGLAAVGITYQRNAQGGGMLCN